MLLIYLNFTCAMNATRKTATTKPLILLWIRTILLDRLNMSVAGIDLSSLSPGQKN